MFAPSISRTLNIDRGRRPPRFSGGGGLSEAVSEGGPVLNKTGRRIQSQRRWSFTASARHRRQMKRQLHPPHVWNIQGVRGRMPPNCIWHACQALLVGIVLFSIGGVMSYVGFEADGVFNSNGTAVGGRAYFYEDARGANVRFSKFSLIGPIIMGVGGFIIVAACVMTFETRDSAAKVGPATYVGPEESSIPYPVIPRSKELKKCAEVRTVSTQTIEFSSFEGLHNLHIFDKKHLVETFRKLSRTVRQSTSKEDEMSRYPSAPDLSEADEDPSKMDRQRHGVPTARRSSCVPKLRNRVPPMLFRQAMSIDGSSSSAFLPVNRQQGILPSTAGKSTMAKTRRIFQRTPTNTSTTSETDNLLSNSQPASRAVSTLSMDSSSSFGSGATVLRQSTGSVGSGNTGTVELHLPNGMVTLNVIHTEGGSMLGGSSTCLRSISPHPSFQSQNDESTCEFGLAKNDNVHLSKSPVPMKAYMKYRSESLGKPALVRQSKVDQAEIICIPDSDEEQRQPIPEAEHETDPDSE